MEKTCKFCNKTITVKNHQSFGAHIVNCKLNPNRQNIIKKRKITKEKKWITVNVNCYVCNSDFNIKVLNKKNIKAKVLLSGPLNWSTGKMTKSLTIPTQHPYGAYSNIINAQPLTISQDSIVDWVMLELLNSENLLLERKVAVVKTNGVILNPDGDEKLNFQNSVLGNKLVIKHRNHLGIMYNNGLINEQFIDFTNPNTSLYGTNPTKKTSQLSALWCGDVNMNGQIKYTGSGNDRDLILIAIGGINPNATLSGYFSEDINMDGVVKYIGTNNDRDLILQTIGGTTPNQIKLIQLP